MNTLEFIAAYVAVCLICGDIYTLRDFGAVDFYAHLDTHKDAE